MWSCGTLYLLAHWLVIRIPVTGLNSFAARTLEWVQAAFLFIRAMRAVRACGGTAEPSTVIIPRVGMGVRGGAVHAVCEVGAGARWQTLLKRRESALRLADFLISEVEERTC